MSSNDEVTNLIQSLACLCAQNSIETDQSAKKEALRLSRSLTVTLEDPVNVATELAFAPLISMGARTAVDMNLFAHIVSHDGPITAAQLASLSGGEQLLISRILRPLSAIGFVKEVGDQVWEATPITKAMASSPVVAGHRFIWEMLIGAAAKAPKYMKETGYRCPTDPHDGLIQYAFQTKLHIFDLLNSMPPVMQDFNHFMGNTMGARKYWVDWFSVQETLLDGAKDNTALIVDVGGGKGHDLEAFHRKYPRRGRLVLQDLPQVIDNIVDLDPVIERITYDFFTDQPVRGARAYFYHHILHDWADNKCLEILHHVKQAMTPGYSKLLLHELVLPDQGASPFQAVLDLAMMTFNSGMERSQKQWQLLLEMAGFEVVKFWVPEEDADGIVEAVVPESL